MKKKILLFFISIGLGFNIAEASIVLTGTRVIYNENQKNVNVEINNVGKETSLIQSWIDEGDETVSPEKIEVPFLISPAITTIKPNEGQTLRISYIKNDKILPKDKESVFWLNVVDIPPEPNNKTNYLQIAVKTRIKLFFRPADLKDKDVKEYYSKVEWKHNKKTKTLEVNNNTPFHFTYVNIDLLNNGKKIEENKNVDMISPYSKKTIKIKNNNINQIKWYLINDYGSVVEGTSDLF